MKKTDPKSNFRTLEEWNFISHMSEHFEQSSVVVGHGSVGLSTEGKGNWSFKTGTLIGLSGPILNLRWRGWRIFRLALERWKRTQFSTKGWESERFMLPYHSLTHIVLGVCWDRLTSLACDERCIEVNCIHRQLDVLKWNYQRRRRRGLSCSCCSKLLWTSNEPDKFNPLVPLDDFRFPF